MYFCKYCNKEFKDKGNLRKHEIYKHEYTKSQLECPCKYCGRLKHIGGGLESHERYCAENPQNKDKIEKRELEKQQRKDFLNRADNCKFCGRLCKNYNSLINHERLCKLNPHHQEQTPHVSGFVIWRQNHPGEDMNHQRGRTKENDPLVAEKARRLSERYKSGELVSSQKGRARTEEEKKKISDGMRRNPNAGGLRVGSGRGKKGWYKGFFCDSTYELAFVIYNLDHNIPFERCPKSIYYLYEYKGKICKYYPDFLLPDGSLVELKGYHSEVVDLKTNSVTDRSIKVIYEKDLQYAFDYIKKMYNIKKVEELYE